MKPYLSDGFRVTREVFCTVLNVEGAVRFAWNSQILLHSIFIGLSGVVVNDSLVLVDFINVRRRTGIPMAPAIHEAGNVPALKMLNYKVEPFILRTLHRRSFAVASDGLPAQKVAFVAPTGPAAE